jgi:succinate dehydrogenase/fumarate reductase cytochrome b subunit
MSEGKRPGGLTALAVINFVFGGFGALGTLAFVALLAIINTAAKSGENEGAAEAQQEMAKAWQEIGLGVFYAMIVLGAVSAILLIVSGVGYLQQKKFLGRTLGNTYAVLSIASSLVMGVVVTADAGGGFNIGTIIGLVYPVLTLILLNGTFKEDFVR